MNTVGQKYSESNLLLKSFCLVAGIAAFVLLFMRHEAPARSGDKAYGGGVRLLLTRNIAEADEFYRNLKVGDVLTFRYVYTTQVTITHRITDIEEIEGGFKITLAGDNKNSEDGQLVQVIDTSIPNNTNYVIGKVTGQAYLLGLLMSFLMQPVGMILLIIVPCFIIILLEVLKIAKVLGADKKKREQEEKEKKDNELEELRRKLAELEKEKAEFTANSEGNKEDKTE